MPTQQEADMLRAEARHEIKKRDAEIERLRAALTEARQFTAYEMQRRGTAWAAELLPKIDAALGYNEQSTLTKET